MPKQVITLDDFSGGVVCNADARDIPINASPDAINIDPLSSNGLLQPIPADTTVFSTSYAGDSDSVSSATSVDRAMFSLNVDGKDYLFVYEVATARYRLYDGTYFAEGFSADKFNNRITNVSQVPNGVIFTTAGRKNYFLGMAKPGPFGIRNLVLEDAMLISPGTLSSFHKLCYSTDGADDHFIGGRYGGNKLYKLKTTDMTLTASYDFRNIVAYTVDSDNTVWVLDKPNNNYYTLYHLTAALALDYACSVAGIANVGAGLEITDMEVTTAGADSQVYFSVGMTSPNSVGYGYSINGVTANGNCSFLFRCAKPTGASALIVTDVTPNMTQIGITTGDWVCRQYATTSSDTTPDLHGTPYLATGNNITYVPQLSLSRDMSDAAEHRVIWYCELATPITIYNSTSTQMWPMYAGAGSDYTYIKHAAWIIEDTDTTRKYRVINLQQISEVSVPRNVAGIYMFDWSFSAIGINSFINSVHAHQMFAQLETGAPNKVRVGLCYGNAMIVTSKVTVSATACTVHDITYTGMSAFHHTFYTDSTDLATILTDEIVFVSTPTTYGSVAQQHALMTREGTPQIFTIAGTGMVDSDETIDLTEITGWNNNILLTVGTITRTAPAVFTDATALYYAFSFMFDGHQESTLLSGFTESTVTANSALIPITIYTNDMPRRVTGICVYRKTALSGLYTLLEQIDFDDARWTTSVSDSKKTLTLVDSAQVGPTYDSINGVSETLPDFNVSYNVSEYGGGYLYVADVAHPEIKNGQNWILRSKPGKPGVIDWSNDFAVMPQKIVALRYYYGRLYAWSNTMLYVLNSETLSIEQQIQGYGTFDQMSTYVYEDGVAFANQAGIYVVTGEKIVELTEGVKVSKTTFNYAYSTRTTDNIFFAYSSKFKSLVVLLNKGIGSFGYAFKEDKVFPFVISSTMTVKAVAVGPDKYIYATLNDASGYTEGLYKLFAASTNRQITWYSKKFNLDGKKSTLYKIKLDTTDGKYTNLAVTYLNTAGSFVGTFSGGVVNSANLSQSKLTDHQIKVAYSSGDTLNQQVDRISVVMRPMIASNANV